MILKHESHSADLFYKTVEGKLDVWLEIEPFDSLAELEFPVFTNEGYVIEAGHEFLEYRLGALSKDSSLPMEWTRSRFMDRRKPLKDSSQRSAISSQQEGVVEDRAMSPATRITDD